MTASTNTTQYSRAKIDRIFKGSIMRTRDAISPFTLIVAEAMRLAVEVADYFYQNKEKRQKYSGFFIKYNKNLTSTFLNEWRDYAIKLRSHMLFVTGKRVELGTAFTDKLDALLIDYPGASEFMNDVTNTFVFRDVIIDGRHITLINSELNKFEELKHLKDLFKKFKEYMIKLSVNNRFLTPSPRRTTYLDYKTNHGVLRFTNFKTNIDTHKARCSDGSLINMDVTKFFDTFTLDKIIQHGYFFKSFLINANYMHTSHVLKASPELDQENKLTLLLFNKFFVLTLPFFMHNGKLPTGLCYSSALSNYLFSFIDKEIYAYIKRLSNSAPGCRIRYSRYVDDITISSHHQRALNEEGNELFNILSIDTVKNIEQILNSYGFYLNYDKTKIFSSKQTKSINGIVIGGNDRVPMSVPSDYKFQLGKDLDAVGTMRGKPSSELLGKLNYVKSINVDQAAYCASHYLKHFDIYANGTLCQYQKSNENNFAYRKRVEEYLVDNGIPHDLSMLTHVGQ